MTIHHDAGAERVCEKQSRKGTNTCLIDNARERRVAHCEGNQQNETKLAMKEKQVQLDLKVCLFSSGKICSGAKVTQGRKFRAREALSNLSC